MSGPDWSEALPTPPASGILLEAWFTTFDQPDAGLLVEDLLPSLLSVNRSVSHELQERTLFFGELGTALERLHGRLTVISSPHQTLGDAPQYPWLWRYVSHFTVGAKSRATQHAKLWAFHWKVGAAERLDVFISSTNLTAPAFRTQIQAGWNASLQLRRLSTAKATRSWGEVIPFLEALGASAGDNATGRIKRLLKLLARAECPAGVSFVASIPGSKRRGARTLRRLAPSSIHVLTPTVGDWTRDALASWSKDLGIAPNKIHLKWLDADHPWSKREAWTLTKRAWKVLINGGIQFDRLPPNSRFSEQHAVGDERWSHAKLYLLAGPRKKRQLLVTSANWSASAWGAGKSASPRNFELGALFETDWQILEEIKERLSVPFCTMRSEINNTTLQWAEASWNGKHIELRVRSSDVSTPVSATVRFSREGTEYVRLIGGAAALRWKDHNDTPLTVQFAQGIERLEVNVVDLRSPVEFLKTPLAEVDPAFVEALRDAFLLQRYGGPEVDIDIVSDRGALHHSPAVSAPTADYAVQSWLDARAAFHVVDQWQEALVKAKADPPLFARVRLDGVELRALYARRGGPAASLAAEELGWHLQEEV